MIKNIILDVGDVLLEYRWQDMLMKDYGLEHKKAIRIGETMFDDPLWDELDLGIRSLESITDDYCRKYPEYQEEISWFLTHGEYMHVARKDVWERVHSLKQAGYRIYLLSNYSQNLFEKHTKDADFIHDIDGMVVSYQVHKIKPNPEIYLHLLHSYDLKPDECIFFDDRSQNTVAARKLGIHAVTITSRQQLLDELEKLSFSKPEC